jgi:hypothetical protein
MKIQILVIKLFFLAALMIISNHNLHLLDSADRQVFFEVYSSWSSEMFSEGFRATGYLVKFEWLPDKNVSLENSEIEVVDFEDNFSIKESSVSVG